MIACNCYAMKEIQNKFHAEDKRQQPLPKEKNFFLRCSVVISNSVRAYFLSFFATAQLD